MLLLTLQKDSKMVHALPKSNCQGNGEAGNGRGTNEPPRPCRLQGCDTSFKQKMIGFRLKNSLRLFISELKGHLMW